MANEISDQDFEKVKQVIRLSKGMAADSIIGMIKIAVPAMDRPAKPTPAMDEAARADFAEKFSGKITVL